MENTAPELERLYFALAARIDLPRAQKRALISDFRRAAEVLVSRGLSPAEAAARLGHERLGDFYLSAPDYWYPLDDAAKIYPMSMTDGWMSVFRLLSLSGCARGAFAAPAGAGHHHAPLSVFRHEDKARRVLALHRRGQAPALPCSLRRSCPARP